MILYRCRFVIFYHIRKTSGVGSAGRFLYW
nr:MAG TPA: hypothetical protein [Caudoviricetes sp.]